MHHKYSISLVLSNLLGKKYTPRRRDVRHWIYSLIASTSQNDMTAGCLRAMLHDAGSVNINNRKENLEKHISSPTFLFIGSSPHFSHSEL
jgi:hypothetical protein